ncbi:MAG: 30S ribosomal protein S9 [Candidatus Eisenbacteria bacterium]|uniref:Small ribosomal subunit protein uS9 n=1 Tax=Eiseniibacteriota bacterium TaxID=2212470 RepID=A0A538S9F9_UNCEI|nr:MAG: 30S ribosomal protein S9 [Candidatus Eisenbacteria bacterium]TMQ59318.1 MAG: 30S ribosomal protein S9 [Candidatus Eisenbacteria bacterium]
MADFMGTGRRKTSIARVRLAAGTGKRTVNGRDLDQYFARLALSRIATQPLVASNTLDRYDLVANVRGGGLTGQAGAISLGIARALLRIDATLRGMLGKEGLLTRDARMKERKKYGQAAARKRFQFSKR